jgi:hypothetical protein
MTIAAKNRKVVGRVRALASNFDVRQRHKVMSLDEPSADIAVKFGEAHRTGLAIVSVVPFRKLGGAAVSL